jgi:glycosyltransferase involved in cell wall biosynthesis
MRFAKPVVISDIPGSGTGWVVHQAGNGLTVPPGDPDALAAAIDQLRRNSREGSNDSAKQALSRWRQILASRASPSRLRGSMPKRSTQPALGKYRTLKSCGNV